MTEIIQIQEKWKPFNINIWYLFILFFLRAVVNVPGFSFSGDEAGGGQLILSAGYFPAQ